MRYDRWWDKTHADVRTSDGQLNLVPINKDSGAPLLYDYDLANSVKLPGAHGEEIVRDMLTDIHVCMLTGSIPLSDHVQTRTTFTCGEDGHIRAWKLAAGEMMEVDDIVEPTKDSKKSSDRKEKRKEKKEKRKGDAKERFKPY